MSQFQDNPRDYALELVERGHDPEYLLLACLKYMGHDDVREMLDANELSPRFLELEHESVADAGDCAVTMPSERYERYDDSYVPRSCGQCGSFGEPGVTCRHCGRGVHGEE